MALSVLITQCLQHDFVGPISAHEPLPNKLHVGREEAVRLLGPEPSRGPVAQLVEWARTQRGRLAVIHIRDWHDPSDARQQAHFANFGAHCVRGTPGAQFVFPEAEGEQVVDALDLNDFEGTRLPDVLRALKAQAPDGKLRVGVVGVWTEAKVTFLMYDLATRAGVEELATCSALTASASRSQHFNALGQVEKLLGARTFDTVGGFTEWLLPDGAPLDLRRDGFAPRITVDRPLEDADRDILGYLYREAARVELAPLGGGFSGASVFRVRSFDAVGHEQAPSVAKLGPRASVGAERVAFEQVESILGNYAPRVRGFVDFGNRAGISYAYAAMGKGDVRTFKKLYESGAPAEKVEAVLEMVFDEILGRFYGVAQYERLPLLDYYGFAPKWASGVKRNVAAIVGEEAAAAPRLSFPGGYEARNVVAFYEEWLPKADTTTGYHYTSLVHGDLNGANILIDGRENVWVIDWQHASRGHVLRDLAKLENDLLYLFTPVSEGELPQALALTKALRQVRDLRDELPEAVSGVTAPALARAWRTLRLLRRLGGKLVREDRSPQQLRIALLRYAAHTLSFDEASPVQKRWGLAAACGWAEDVMASADRAERLRVDWLAMDDLRAPGRLGLTLCPGRRDRGRSLDEDLDALVADGADALVSLVAESELEWYGVPDLRPGATARGLDFKHLPIRDQGTPGIEEAREVVDWLLAHVDAGRRVVVHCIGGLGRSGTIAACALVAKGLSPGEAIAAVRRARSPRAIETAEQEAFVAQFAEK